MASSTMPAGKRSVSRTGLQVHTLQVHVGVAGVDEVEDSPHSEDGVAVPLRVVGDGQAGLPAGEDDGLALHTTVTTDD